MSEPFKVLGIDFGTTNTICCGAQSDWRQVEPVHFSTNENHASLATALLYKQGTEGKWEVLAWGNKAEEEWGTRAPEERKHLRLATNFKPDLASSEEARQYARDFLACIVRELTTSAKLNGNHLGKINRTVIGVPSKTLSGHGKTTLQVAKEAGFTAVELIEEPKGALAHHIHVRDMEHHRVSSGVLVVDFGGGTCDLAFLKGGKCVHSWGDPLFGGRLIDDLFFQWLCDQNPGLEERLVNEHADYIIHWVRCRKLKEHFSDVMRRDRKSQVHYHDLYGFGGFRNGTWEEFERRLRAYQPTGSFRRLLFDLGPNYATLAEASPMDLVRRFEELLASGEQGHKLRDGDIDYVILTGGSSLWPWVRDAVCRILSVSQDRILQSGDPRSAIGRGLALIPVRQRRVAEIQEQLRAERNTQVADLTERVQVVIDQFLQTISQDVSSEFVAKHLRPLFERMNHSEDLWSLGDLRRWLEEEANAFEMETREIVKRREPELNATVHAEINSSLTKWLEGHAIRWEFILPNRTDTNIPSAVESLPNIYLTIADTLAAIVGLVIALITAAICGGHGMALLVAGPIGWLIGFILAAATAALVVWYGRDKVKEMAESLPVPKPLRYFIVSDSSAAKFESQLQVTIAEKLNEELAKRGAELHEKIDLVISNIIEDLNWINRL